MRKLSIVPICTLLLGLYAAAGPAGAAQFVIVLNPGGTSWKIVEADRITFNQKDKVRIGSAERKTFSPDEYHSKMTATPLAPTWVIRRDAEEYLVKKSEKGWDPIAPDGLSFKGSTDYPTVWSNVTATSQMGKNNKAATPLAAADVFAILPGGDPATVAKFIADESNFQHLGEKEEKAFDQRMSLLEFVAQSASGEAAETLKKVLLDAMQKDIRGLSTGIVKEATLTSALRYVPVSEQAFPKDDAQIKARQALTVMRESLDRRIAILKALNAGEMWDALIVKYGDFERWDGSFEEVRKMREDAFKKSAAVHLAEANRLADMKQYAPELDELKIADQRLPGDAGIAARIEAVRARVEAGGGGGTGSAIKARKPEDPTSPEYRLVNRYLADALTYEGLLQFKEADEQLKKAEELTKDLYSPRVMLARARYYDAHKKPQDALAILDRYMASVSGETEMNEGDGLRSHIRLTLQKKRQDLLTDLGNSMDKNDFSKALADTKEWLELDPNDVEFLLDSAKLDAILRQNPAAQKALNDYLKDSSVGNATQRADVYAMLTKVQPVTLPADGAANWFSGFKSPPGVFYCPTSLAPGAPILKVLGSRKFVATYDWAGAQLTAIHSGSQEPGEHAVQIFFDYSKDGTRVRRVSTILPESKGDSAKEDQLMRFSEADLVQATKDGKAVYPVLANHPLVDPIMAGRLTSKNVAVLVTGNPYFNPFAWDGLYAYLAHYDDQGRVVSATEIVEGRTPHKLVFNWDGPRLIEIADQSGGYDRKMSYTNGRLSAETISFQGKIARIEYRYNGDRLTSAKSDEDPSLDNRRRDITFR